MNSLIMMEAIKMEWIVVFIVYILGRLNFNLTKNKVGI